MKLEIETEFALGEEVAFVRTVQFRPEEKVALVGIGEVVSVIAGKSSIPGPVPETYVVRHEGRILEFPREALRHQALQAAKEAQKANAWLYDNFPKEQKDEEPKPAEVKP